ncbi:hypothetical protein EMIT07CA2_150096 [Brevibacillus sp. IT-7CA2]
MPTDKKTATDSLVAVFFRFALINMCYNNAGKKKERGENVCHSYRLFAKYGKNNSRRSTSYTVQSLFWPKIFWRWLVKK